MKRPLGLVAVFYAAGLLLAECFQPSLPLLFAVSLTTTAIALLARRIRPLLIWPLLALVGWTNLVWRTAVVSPNDLRRQLTDTAEDVVVRGTLSETPSGRIYVHDETEMSRTLARLSLTSIRRHRRWRKGCSITGLTCAGREFISH